jgi:DNA-binding protein YbaB
MLNIKGIKIQVNAKNEFLNLSLPEDLLKEKKEKAVLSAFEKGRQEAQAVMAQESKKLMGGMKFQD